MYVCIKAETSVIGKNLSSQLRNATSKFNDKLQINMSLNQIMMCHPN